MLRSIFIGVCSVFLLAGCQDDSVAKSGSVTATGTAQIGGPFTLVNQDGVTVTETDLQGKPQLIYFGFSYCPDVCPLALQQIGAVLADVDPKHEIFRPVFFSVDPERDTPEALKQYVTAPGFPPNLTALTGTQEQVDVAKKAYKIYSAKVEDPESSAGYTVDHVSLIYLMDKDGGFVDVFTHNTTVPEIIDRLKAYVKSENL